MTFTLQQNLLNIQIILYVCTCTWRTFKTCKGVKSASEIAPAHTGKFLLYWTMMRKKNRYAWGFCPFYGHMFWHDVYDSVKMSLVRVAFIFQLSCFKDVCCMEHLHLFKLTSVTEQPAPEFKCEHILKFINNNNNKNIYIWQAAQAVRMCIFL